MLCSEDKEERDFSVTQILKICEKIMFGDMKPRARKNPVLNIAETSLMDLID